MPRERIYIVMQHDLNLEMLTKSRIRTYVLCIKQKTMKQSAIMAIIRREKPRFQEKNSRNEEKENLGYAMRTLPGQQHKRNEEMLKKTKRFVM